MGYYPAYVASRSDQVLAYPHYSDERWDTAQLIYGRECKTNECNYSDRLYQWDYEAADRASKSCKEAGLDQRTAQGIEAWLGFYHQKPVKLRYIFGGSNRANGYPYYVYGYDYVIQD